MKYRIFQGPCGARVAVNTEIDHKVIALSEVNWGRSDGGTDHCIQVCSEEGTFTIISTLEKAIGFFQECAERSKPATTSLSEKDIELQQLRDFVVKIARHDHELITMDGELVSKEASVLLENLTQSRRDAEGEG